MALKTEGVENTVHDFFTPEPAKGISPPFLITDQLFNGIMYRYKVLLPPPSLARLARRQVSGDLKEYHPSNGKGELDSD